MRNLEARVNLLDQSLLTETKSINRSLIENADMLKLAQDKLENITADTANIKRDMAKLVTRSELRSVEGYIDLIKPITSKFVTKKEVEEIIAEKIEAATA